MSSYLGTNGIGKLYLGGTEIAKAYLGSSLIYESGGGGGDWGDLERHETVSATMSNKLLSSYDDSDYNYDSLSNVGNAYTNSTSNYAQIGLAKGASILSYMYFKWDLSEIPADATINSVTCVCRATVTNTSASNVAGRNVGMFCGDTLKGDYTSITTTATDRTLSVGSWTRAELNDAKIRIAARRGTSNVNTAYYLRMFYAKLTVEYTYTQYYYTVKVRNSVTGLTVTPEQEEYEAGETATLTFSGLSSGFTVLDNGTDVTNLLVQDGDNLVYTIADLGEGHRIECKA